MGTPLGVLADMLCHDFVYSYTLKNRILSDCVTLIMHNIEYSRELCCLICSCEDYKTKLVWFIPNHHGWIIDISKNEYVRMPSR